MPSLVDNISNDIQEIKLPVHEKDGKLLTQILFNSIVRDVIDKVEGCEDVLTEDYIYFLLERAMLLEQQPEHCCHINSMTAMVVGTSIQLLKKFISVPMIRR